MYGAPGTGLVLGMSICHSHAAVRCADITPIAEKKTLRRGF